MKIKILGSAAAEGIPAIFCNCDICKKARELGGKDIRTRAQVMIDSELMIDFPPDTYMHALNHGVDLTAIKTFLITHSHSDHLYPMDFVMRGGAVYGHNLTSEKCDIILNSSAKELFTQQINGEMPSDVAKDINLIEAKPFSEILSNGYKITTLHANHMQYEEALNYVVQNGGKTLLSLFDTGVPFKETMDFLTEHKIKADIVLMDSTSGIYRNAPNQRHMGFPNNIELKFELINKGIASHATKFVATHFSHNGLVTHQDLLKLAEGTDIAIAYDGFEIEV